MDELLITMLGKAI